MDYNVRYLYGPTGVLVSLVLASIRQPVVVARSQVYVAPYASGTCPNLFLFFKKKKCVFSTPPASNGKGACV